MTISRVIAIMLFVNAFSMWGAPTLVPYDARNAQTRKATLALYKNAHPTIEDKNLPLFLDENPTQAGMLQGSILIDDNNKIIGLVIYIPGKSKGRKIAHIHEFILDKKNNSFAKDLLRTFEQEKKQEKYDLITIDAANDNKNTFKSLAFKENSDGNFLVKNISESSSSSSSSSSIK